MRSHEGDSNQVEVHVRKERDTGRKTTWRRGHIRTAQGGHLCSESSGEIKSSSTVTLWLIVKRELGHLACRVQQYERVVNHRLWHCAALNSSTEKHS